ncbi:MAG: mechanosensitive ion channel family protein [Desulfobacterales bacterium]|nr:mechanosensitive ion channel family protein [Desulfobacterales bacterium]
MMEFVGWQFLGNSVGQWGTALAVLIILNLFFNLVKRWLVRRFEAGRMFIKGGLAEGLAEIFRRTKRIVLFFVALYLACFWLALPLKIKTLIESVAFIAVVIQVGLWGHSLIYIGLKQYVGRKVEDPATSSGVRVMSLFGRFVLWSFVLLVILENVGVNVTTLIASLGVGGIAIGLATQNILSDLFASLSILLDRPFEVGHFIIVGEQLGTVERIGLKTTRLRSLSGEMLVFGNNDLLSSRIHNYAHFWERRVVFSFGVLYETPSEKLKKVPGIVRGVIEKVEQARFDRAHFKEFGDFSLNFEVVYYVLSPDYTVYMDIQEKINLGIFEAFEKEGLGFAFPTQTIHIASQPSGNVVTRPA